MRTSFLAAGPRTSVARTDAREVYAAQLEQLRAQIELGRRFCAPSPLAVQHVGLAPQDVLDVARVDQQHREAAAFEQLEQGDSVDTGGLHGHDIHAAGRRP